ncbi:F-box and WD repeat domain containing protein 10B-like [Hyla sarda]|uniref:F-box and WD repeat domain containing protein 10B-like n=1 Tax=Hyla sarda TaxID=327740 RepID=UPI0024C3E5D7|nr:F-box and WD repeat domain containing protein 10B-like [Hyla sarda]
MEAMEISEFRLQCAPDLRCENQSSRMPLCQVCETCVLATKLALTKELFIRAGHGSQRKFLFGVIRRFRSLDLLVHMEKVLEPALGKDFTYSRSRINPSLAQDFSTSSSDRALNKHELHLFMMETWEWFGSGTYWTKANYALHLLQMCSSHLLLSAANLIHVLIGQEGQQAESHEKKSKVQESGKKRGCSQDDPSLMVVPTSFQSTSGVSKYKDFIRCLPVHLSKKILGYLKKKHLYSCLFVSHHWCYLTKDLLQDLDAETLVRNEAMILQGTSYKGVSVSYAKIQTVPVPKVGEDGNALPRLEKYYQEIKSGESLEAAYTDIETEAVSMEERNLFCGSYNVLILTGQGDPHRVIHFDGGRLVAVGSRDRRVKLYDMADMAQIPPLIQGHSGSIRAVRLCEERGFVFSGGFDLSIRQWDLRSGLCLRIYHGHMKTITCLDVQEDFLVSGAKDGLVKVWDITTGKCLRTYKHKDAVLAVIMRGQIVVSGCDKGLVKVWSVESAELIKTLSGHQGAIRCLSFDQWHLVSGSSDGFVIAWSMMGTFQKRLMSFRHPKEVMCLELLYLRVITGCADGKIRVFNVLNGDCLRVMRANSRADPVAALCIRDNRMVINVLTSIMIFQFEEVSWDYSQASQRVHVQKDRQRFQEAEMQLRPYSYVRAQRMKRVGSSNRKIYQQDEEDTGQGAKSRLSHHARSLSAGSMKRAHDLHLESLKPATWPELRNYRRSFAYIDLQPEFYKKPPSACIPPTTRESNPELWSRASTAPAMKTKEDSDDESGYGSPGRKSALSMSENAVLQRMKQRGPHTPMSPNQILLRVSTIHNSQKMDAIGSNMEYNSRIRDTWGDTPSGNVRKMFTSPSLPTESQNVDPLTLLQHLKSSAVPVDMRTVLTAFEIRKLGLKMRESLHGPDICSTIPGPTLIRPQTTCDYQRTEKPNVSHRRSTSALEAGVKRIGLYTSCESIQPVRMIMGQNIEINIPKRKAPDPAASADPYRERSCFQLLTVKQLKEFQAEKTLRQKEVDAHVQATKNKESRKAWLKKITGKNIDDFTKAGKIAAPEFGPDVFL